jgi:hypothetical protein
MKPTTRKIGIIFSLFLLAVGCASLKPPPGRDAYNDYVPHKDIGARPGSPENPNTGWNNLVVALLQAAFPPK